MGRWPSSLSRDLLVSGAVSHARSNRGNGLGRTQTEPLNRIHELLELMPGREASQVPVRPAGPANC